MYRRSQHKAVCVQVDFEAVPDLVAHRKVFVHQGQAYIHRTEVTSLVVGHFRYCFHRFICCSEHQCSSGLSASRHSRYSMRSKLLGVSTEHYSLRTAAVSILRTAYVVLKHCLVCCKSKVSACPEVVWTALHADALMTICMLNIQPSDLHKQGRIPDGLCIAQYAGDCS